ncbi:hypothetical protein L1987_14508 [Smallanthus sonchifolius]|uniref:Uncharacterized protein n=1 Tax=Smallanthus sonchifolius TaxID=185202 RepID=A0ACB9J577_9ASTR|nr:hypothetical protein L1987_14508 [Smallanthus sonchifolius]
MIEPDGGWLVELVVPESQREVVGLPKIKISGIDLEWVHVLSEGWSSPLTGLLFYHWAQKENPKINIFEKEEAENCQLDDGGEYKRD